MYVKLVYLLVIVILLLICSYLVFYYLPNNRTKFCLENFCVRLYFSHGLTAIKELFEFYDKLIRVMPCNDTMTTKLKNNFNKNVIFEVDPNNHRKWTSFTIDKGKQMGLCLRDKKNNYHDINTLKFVFLHELAHIASNTFDHTTEFWKNFKRLLEIAYNNDLIELINYEIHNTPYCGIVIDYNPYLDPML